MIVEKKPWLISVIDEHFEELQALWLMRCDKAHARDWFCTDIAKIDSRIAAHADALVLSFPHSQVQYAEFLAGSEEQVFSACLPLLYRTDAEDFLRAGIETATKKNQLGWAFAFCCAPPFAQRTELQRVEGMSRCATDIISLGLSAHGLANLEEEIGDRLSQSEEEQSNLINWMLLADSTATLASGLLESAWNSVDAKRKTAASQAMLWSAQPWLLEFCRDQVRESKVRLFAAEILSLVGDDSDLSSIAEVMADETLGVRRLQLASNAGCPQFIPLMCELLNSSDAATVVAAGLEFTRLTGLDISSHEVVEINNQPADEFEAAFVEEALVPDVAAAQLAWEEHETQWTAFKRIHRGQETSDLERPLTAHADLYENYRSKLRRAFLHKTRQRFVTTIVPSGPLQLFCE